MVDGGKGRVAGVDALRGASILLVVLNHLAIRLPLLRASTQTPIVTRLANTLTSNGYEAVFVFFVLSGFLITETARFRWGGLARLRATEFYLRRFARIAPLLVILVIALSMMHELRMPNFMIHGQGQSLSGAIFAALSMHLNLYEANVGYLPAGWDVLWSLSIEEVFYVLFPLMCCIRFTRPALPFTLALLALSLPIERAALAGDRIWQEKAYLPGMSAIATGIVASALASTLPRLNHRLCVLLAVFGLTNLAAVFIFEDLIWQKIHNGTMLLLTIGAASVAVASVRMRGFVGGRLFSPLRLAGSLSYEIYLGHIFLIFALLSLRSLSNTTMDLPNWMWYLVALVTSLGLGWCVRAFLSGPSERLLLRMAIPLTASSVSTSLEPLRNEL